MDKNYTGNAIRHIRIKQGKSVEEIQDELNKMGFTRFVKNYTKIEKQEAKLYSNELPAICSILGVSVEQLYELANKLAPIDKRVNL